MRNLQRKQARNAFTMIELIFAIVIIGILASVAIPKLSGTRDDAKIVTELSNLRTAKTDVLAHMITDGNFSTAPSNSLNCFTFSDVNNEIVVSASTNTDTYCVQARTDANNSGMSDSLGY